MRKNTLISAITRRLHRSVAPQGAVHDAANQVRTISYSRACKLEDVNKGDVVYCKVNGRIYLHLAKKIGDDGRVLITNNHGHENGWTKIIYGKLTKVEE